MLEPFCGPKNMKPIMKMAPYTPFKDLHNGDFILTQPLDPEVYLVWLGRTNSDVVKCEEFLHTLLREDMQLTKLIQGWKYYVVVF
jgi:hypothetical protein